MKTREKKIMDRLRGHRARMVFVAFVAFGACRELKAQTTTSATSSATGTATGTGMGVGVGGMDMGGMGLMPMMSAMSPSANLSPTDASALGMPGGNNGSLGMNPMNGVFMNPMAAPYLLGYPMSNTQIGGMMMMNQMNNGIGSGQMSGVRPGPGQSNARTKQSPSKPRGNAATPGGLASRYFNRTTSVNRPPTVSRIPQNYYTRQNRYYPQVSR
jgi:hypothetical protein